MENGNEIGLKPSVCLGKHVNQRKHRQCLVSGYRDDKEGEEEEVMRDVIGNWGCSSQLGYISTEHGFGWLYI